MIEKIINAPNKKMEIVEYLRNSKNELVMYGAGSYAKDVAIFLEHHGITSDKVAVHKDYVGNSDLQNIDNVIHTSENLDVIIAFSGYKDELKRLRELPNINCFVIDVPNEDVLFDYQFVVDNEKSFTELYNKLSDELSKQILLAYINSKVSGDGSYIYNLNSLRNKEEIQYFPDFVDLNADTVLVDCGAYNGDTIFDFVAKTSGLYKKIYAFEPSTVNAHELEQNTKSLENITIINKAAYSNSTNLPFYESDQHGMLSRIDESSAFYISTDTIDNSVSENSSIFIKMDIEGSEVEAIKGSSQKIQGGATLAISIYHKKDDLLTIPSIILDINPDYNLYLRHYRDFSYDTVLFAIPKKDKQR